MIPFFAFYGDLEMQLKLTFIIELVIFNCTGGLIIYSPCNIFTEICLS